MIKQKKSTDMFLRYLVLAGELFLLNCLLVGLYFFYLHFVGALPPFYKRMMILMTLCYAMINLQAGTVLQNHFVRGDEILRQALLNFFGFFFLSAVVLWTVHWPLFTLKWLIPYYVAILVFVVTYRWAMRQIIRWVRSRSQNRKRVVFVGDVNIGIELFNAMREDLSTGYEVIGYFADEPSEGIDEKLYLGTTDKVFDLLSENGSRLYSLICLLPSSQKTTIRSIIRCCENHFVRFQAIPSIFTYAKHNMTFALEANTPVFAYRNEPLEIRGNRILKRCFDLFVSGAFLVTVFPVVFVIFGLWIKLSSRGPIFFKQKRSGLNGKEFYCYKFRSMRVNADSDTQQARPGDDRVTRVGRLMRKTNIDELPQFINVFLGDMSLVGPRPHMLLHTEQYSQLIGHYMVRHFAKPGITGYAQVSGFRGETSELWQMEGRVKCDIWYIEHWSFVLDLFIMWKTVINVIRGDKDAY